MAAAIVVEEHVAVSIIVPWSETMLTWSCRHFPLVFSPDLCPLPPCSKLMNASNLALFGEYGGSELILPLPGYASLG
ncbi:hypothetical protein [Oryza sativa Japonica Group]|uniref:Uncharacterized protein n=1 Tax=Oryza sativa subsp. japonica TaxID=39947 RepID=Q5N7K1_ORYSJ|nr:hypothetical protein [Oryza sativa Japonica Group]